ncbi:hypothetical protein BBP40_006723 [Aspergillus hancockii]|nr:hypothetical protein BBP40_006723 [Aspergillus hancockii]
MSVSGDFGPAPPGVNLAENQNAAMLGAVITLMVVGSLSVVLRLYARTEFKKLNHLAVDDYLIFVAMLFAYGLGVCVIISIQFKNGHHIQVLTKHEFTAIWKLLFSHVILYAFCVTCTKTSIIMFYNRIFNLHYSLYFVMFFILGYFLAVVITINVACHPIPYFWEQYTSPQTTTGTCIDIPRFFFGNGIAAVLVDIMILAVPVPVIWNLQMPKSQRMAVISILLLGSFVCVASIVRIIFLGRNTHSHDATWTIAPVFVWSCVEPSIGIVCACLPTLSPLFRRCWSIIARHPGTATAKPPPMSGFNDRTRRSRLASQSVLWPRGDEVELFGAYEEDMSSSMRTKVSEEDLASRIRVKEEVMITYS